MAYSSLDITQGIYILWHGINLVYIAQLVLPNGGLVEVS